MKRTVTGGHGVLEWLGDPARPWLHFAHATGMCADLYAELLDPLAAEFNIVASDARGHGQSVLPADPASLTSWRVFQDDLAVLLARYHPGRWLLAGHSMGASVSFELAARRPDLASAVVLVEPASIPFADAAAYEAARSAGTPRPNPMAEQAARRRSVFASRDAARDNWRGRGVFAGWSDTALDAYVRGGMRDTAEGAELACAPAWEGATFASVTTGVAAALAAWRGPLALLHGTVASTVPQPDADTIAASGATVERIDGASHFLPLEHPERVRAAIRRLAAGTPPGEAAFT
ncbi:alpha/beta hydrolase [Sphingosinicellaceae bacterium]|nr:alpha/beta hydrolase [Sphingosinicellaceae bacterium]